MVRPTTGSAHRRAGFTILEALAVVAIIAVSAALAAPALSAAMAQRRAGEATHELVRLGALARSEAIAYGRAHLLQYSPSSGSGSHGRALLWRGRVNLCSANEWSEILTGTCDTNPSCIAGLDMDRYDHGTHQVRMRLEGATAGANICFQPDGEMRFQMGSGTWSTTPPSGSEGVRFRFERLEDGAQTGVDRRVVFPFGATPRIVR